MPRQDRDTIQTMGVLFRGDKWIGKHDPDVRGSVRMGRTMQPHILRSGWFVLLGFLSLAGSAFSQVDQMIYSDSLVNGWQDWSWATVNTNNTSPLHSGSHSISVTATAWQALYLHHDTFDTSGYTNLIFWIHGGASGGQQGERGERTGERRRPAAAARAYA